MQTILSNSKITATIAHLGAELISLKNHHNKEYIWEGNPEFWGKHSPVLFPIVGALKNNSYLFNDKEYQLSRHGFAREMNFTLVNSTAETAIFSIQSNPETLQVYPFEFEFQISYTLEDSKISIAYTVINKNKTSMFFSVGAHPAIALPENFESYSLQFEKSEKANYYLLADNLISDKTKELDLNEKSLPLHYELFEKDALIFKNLESNALTILENKKPYLKVVFTDFPSLGIWTVVNAPFVCIEPWLGYADTFQNNGRLEDKEGIIELLADKNFKAQFSLEIL
ncbi:aldose 1-epimerase family protein [Flavobacterium agrisoli]|uniref:Aldose 1-epimerase family protein n=1 Tax=Flavobacterium agrisoli TaxID=2793066 RepID=A0A934PIA7_9FLAO|nr:aldose 1-epimerase family protein [Flavobacterium agrisoli]MBK0368592.1 aldose 1-epimerase family protein [Flavobacterium agrisoli]